MCEANVYIRRQGQEKLLMEKVDRLIPGDDNNIFMENIFGERKVFQGKIKEMQLLDHRIIVEEIKQVAKVLEQEIWLTLDTEHGHFHTGEDVKLNLFKGYNMKNISNLEITQPQLFVVHEDKNREIGLNLHNGIYQANLGEEADGLIQIYACEIADKQLYAKIFVEIGHHHHREIKAIGLPLEIMPSNYQHARMGESYEIKVLKDGLPLPNAQVKATYSGTSNKDYPHQLLTDEEGKLSIFLSARGNYLFSASDGNIISTFTLSKSF